MHEVAVSDSGPLISLEKIEDGYGFIRKLYTSLFVPQVVLDEVSGGDAYAYLSQYQTADFLTIHEPIPVPPINGMDDLHEGERQAIALALVHDTVLLIQEEAGRKVAQRAGVPISGIAGQIVKAVKENLITPEDGIAKLIAMQRNARLPKKLTQQLVSAIRSNFSTA